MILTALRTAGSPLRELAAPPPPCEGCLLGTTKLQTTFLTSTYFFGACASWALLTVVAFQIHTYHTSPKNDSIYFRALVYALFCLHMAETGLLTYGTYITDAENWGNPEVILMIKAEIAEDIQPFLIGISACVVQTFFTWRIWKFSMAVGSSTVKAITRLLCGLITLAGIGALGSSFALVVVTFHFQGLLPKWIADLVAVWSVTSVTADTIISVCLISMLFHARSQSISSETRSKIARIILRSVETGIVTTVLALFIAVLDLKHIFGLYGLPAYAVGKSYMISFLANLNARQSGTVHGNVETTPPPMTSIKFSPNRDRTEQHTSFNLSTMLRSLGTSLGTSQQGQAPESSQQTGTSGSEAFTSSQGNSFIVKEETREVKVEKDNGEIHEQV